MEDIKEVNQETLTPEEEAKEESALKETPDFKSEIIKDLGIDPEDSEAIEENKELIDKFVAKEVANFAKTKSIVGTKNKFKEELLTLKKQLDELKQEPLKEEAPIPADEIISKKVREELEKEKLNSLQLPEEVKKQVEIYVKQNNVSLDEALKSEYITYLKDRHEKEQKEQEASIKFSGKSYAAKDVSEINPAEIDPTTPEGQKAHEELKKEAMKQE